MSARKHIPQPENLPVPTDGYGGLTGDKGTESARGTQLWEQENKIILIISIIFPGVYFIRSRLWCEVSSCCTFQQPQPSGQGRSKQIHLSPSPCRRKPRRCNRVYFRGSVCRGRALEACREDTDDWEQFHLLLKTLSDWRAPHLSPAARARRVPQPPIAACSFPILLLCGSSLGFPGEQRPLSLQSCPSEPATIPN